jgi:hypothetical protein
MKSVFMLGLLMISVLGADWQRVVGFSDAPIVPDEKVMKSDDSGLFIRVSIAGYNEQDTTVESKAFKRVDIPDEAIDRDTLNVGKPQIPYVRLLIAVPDSCELDLSVHPCDGYAFSDNLLYPVPRIIFEDTNSCVCAKEVYAFDTLFYEKDTLYPGVFYELINDGHWRDQRVLDIVLYPVQVNPAQELMYFYTRFDCRIEYAGDPYPNANGLGPFEEIGRELLLNYPGIDREPESVPEPTFHYYTDLEDTTNVADYLIVMGTDFYYNETASYWLEQLAQWRVDHNRFNVGLVKMEDVYEQFDSLAPDSAAQLRDFLLYAYANWQAPVMPDGHFAYCLFVGDWDYVPTELDTYWVSSPPGYWMLGAYDSYFACLDDDSWADFMLGRWPVKETKTQDLITIAEKTLNYEQDPDTGGWRRDGLLIAGFDYTFDCHVDRAKPYFSDIGYDTITVRQSELSPDSFRDSVAHYLNQGEIITFYADHGAPDGWYNFGRDNLTKLTNGTRLPVVLSMACLTASFQWDHPFYENHPAWPRSDSCFGELFLVHPDGGAVAFWGATKYAYFADYEKALMHLLRHQHWILGLCLLPAWQRNSYCLLGDPALDLGDYTAYPNLPDLVVRPRGIDISLLSSYPYPTSGDSIRMQAEVFNIGRTAAYDVDVRFDVVLEQTITSQTVVVDTIRPRDSVVVTAHWNTGATHQNYYGEIGDCDFIVTADPDSEITESWELNNQSSINKKVALYPHQPGWPKQMIAFTEPAIGNLDNAGSVEIVYAGLDSVYVFNPSGNPVLDWPQYFKGVSGLVLGDIIGDNTLEVIAVSPESIKVFDYQGDVLSGWPVQIPYYNNDYRIRGLPALGVISGIANGYREIVVPIVHEFSGTPPPARNLKVLVYGHNGTLVYELNSSRTNGTSMMDSVGLAVEDMCSAGCDEITISYVDAETADERTDIFNKNGLVDYFTRGNSDMTPALTDLGTNGFAEVIVGGRDGRITAYDVSSDTVLWSPQTEAAIHSSPAVGDIHPQYDEVEITFGNNASRVHLRENEYGYSIDPWPYPVTPSGYIRKSPAIANINGDKYPDVIVGADNYYVYAFKYNRDPIAPYPLPLFGKPSSPLIGDIDGDKLSEIVITSFDGYLHVWENQASEVVAYSLEWPQFHHDYQRTGLYNWVRGLRGGDANPKEFSTATTISFTLKDNLDTQMRVYDVAGNLVRNLVSQTLPAGTYNPVWYGNNNNFALLPNGLYFIEIRVNNESKITIVEINR